MQMSLDLLTPSGRLRRLKELWDAGRSTESAYAQIIEEEQQAIARLASGRREPPETLLRHVFDDDVLAEIRQHDASRALVDQLAAKRPDLLESLALDLLDFEAPVLLRFRELDLAVTFRHERGPVDAFAAVCRELADEIHDELLARGWAWGTNTNGQAPDHTARGETDG